MKLVLSHPLLLLVRSAKSFVLSSPSVFPSLLALRLHGWRWRPLINFSRSLALFVRRYGIFPLRFSNRSSILDPSDPSIPFFFLFSLSLSFLPFPPSIFLPGPPTGYLPLPSASISPCVRECAWAADSAVRMGRIRERMPKTKKKAMLGFFYSRNARSNMNMH